MHQYVLLVLVAAVFVASQLHGTAADAKSLDSATAAEHHHQAKLLHQRQRRAEEAAAAAAEAAAAVAAPVTPNMWSILGQSAKGDQSPGRTIGPRAATDYALVHRHRHKHHRPAVSGELPDALPDELPAAPARTNCPKCQRADEPVMTEEQLTELRIAYVKNQILKKLKLTERPNVSLSGVPRPVAEGATFQPDDNAEAEALKRHAEEFYAKTKQKIIFPQLGE